MTAGIIAKYSKNKNHIDRIMKKDRPDDIMEILHSGVKTMDHIEHALNHENGWVRDTAASHPKLQKHHLTKLLNDKDWYVRLTAMHHNKIDSDHVKKAMDDPNNDVRAVAKDRIRKKNYIRV